MYPRCEEANVHWDRIPDALDVLVTHGPPYGILDQTTSDEPHLGCEELLKAVRQKRPRVHVFGHIHGGAGTYDDGSTHFVNAAGLSCGSSIFSPVRQPTLVAESLRKSLTRKHRSGYSSALRKQSLIVKWHCYTERSRSDFDTSQQWIRWWLGDDGEIQFSGDYRMDQYKSKHALHPKPQVGMQREMNPQDRSNRRWVHIGVVTDGDDRANLIVCCTSEPDRFLEQ